ncbi:hypothetical protein [Bacillus andreraoultii]|uniref:hypothetical protein n=1 Tax=Bacillus andreraoultii TaxID=1499685 RepID=UPI00053A5F27|nr:hypothetical protein [Bacillus andreraoultii]
MFWKISDFTDEIKKAVGDKKLNRKTVDTWFKKLEDDGIHYVNRTEDTNEKVYDGLDLQIGIFIKRKRNENWSLNAIFNEIRDQFDVRPIPIEMQENDLSPLPIPQLSSLMQKLHIGNIKEELLTEVRGAYEEVAASQLQELKSYVDSIVKRLPQENMDDERERRFQDLVVRRRVEYQLEKEALLLWTAKPFDERYKKVGWFRKEEDITKRDLFVKDFINRHFSERIKREMIYEERDSREEITV